MWKIILTIESVDKYAEDLQQDVHVRSVNVIKTQLQKTNKLYYRCGWKHQVAACLFKVAECRACKKKAILPNCALANQM